MSLFSNLLQWALRAAASDQGKQLAIKAVGEGADALLKAVTTHAPDVSADAKVHLNNAIAVALAGVLTRSES